jgi:hypothetical protein
MTRGAVRTWFAEDVRPGPAHSKLKRDLYSFAAKAKRQKRKGLERDLLDLATGLSLIEGRIKMWANVTLEGKGAAPLDSAHGGGDGTPAEVRASLALRDTAQRVRELVDDWCRS